MPTDGVRQLIIILDEKNHARLFRPPLPNTTYTFRPPHILQPNPKGP